MSSPENPNWVFDCGLFDDIAVSGGDLPCLDPPMPLWSSQSPLNLELDDSYGNPDGFNELGSRKRARSGSCAASSSKACREKMRRDRLNERFLELGCILDPERPPKVDKTVALVEAIRMVTELRDEAQKLRESNQNLQETINELKIEKNELRDEKQKLKAQKENLEKKMKGLIRKPHPGFVTYPTPFSSSPGHVIGGKLVPFVGYPHAVSMWQFMPPATIDTSQDHILHPPVA